MEGIRNGRLLALAASGFEVFITCDGNIGFQQNIARLAIAVIVLKARRTRLRETPLLMPEVLRRLPSLLPDSVTEVAA